MFARYLMAVPAGAVCLFGGLALADTPKMKMTTDIPATITAPDSVQTSIGTLNYFDGVPDAATVKTTYDYLDRSREVNVFVRRDGNVV